MASNTTRDHDFIREWAEKRGGKPAEVASTETEGAPGILRLEFPDAPNANDDALKEISWDDFFAKFDESGLELLYQEETAEGEQSNFNKLIYPEPDSPEGKQLLAKTARKKSSAKKGSGKAASKGATKSAGTKSTAKTASKLSSKTASKGATKTASKGAAKTASKGAAKKTAAKKVSLKASAKTVPSKKSAGKKTALKGAAKKAAEKKSAGKKAAVKKVPGKKVAAKKVAGKKSAAKKGSR